MNLTGSMLQALLEELREIHPELIYSIYDELIIVNTMGFIWYIAIADGQARVGSQLAEHRICLADPTSLEQIQSLIIGPAWGLIRGYK
jgi:hypothetical protein